MPVRTFLSRARAFQSLFLLLLLSTTACQSRAPDPPHNFALACDVARASAGATLLCVRTDTRNGETKVVALPKLAISPGTAATSKPAGTFQIECHSTSLPDSTDFRCVRMDRDTGEMMLLDMEKLGRVPE